MSRRLYIFIFIFISFSASAQEKPSDKYPSLLWEITGNGLSRPSYLFGTMHVSSKLAFHLSDSFYHALRSVDAVALELNPEVWQGQMAKLDKLKDNYSAFASPAGNEIITENTFRIQNYIDELTAALRTEPSVVNNLLYRSYKAREDFEEDTFLDMYIYQTGRKLGKKPAGVEDYYEAEKLVLEAYGDMAREKKKRNIDLDGKNIRDISEKVQNAYKRGDLDLMDSLDNLMERSEAFREKFLYKRNEIQAHSIDSIIRMQSLFAGVGAAHLPGQRGVIEILRKKGYKLRPIRMADRDGVQKNEIDKLKVPVVFENRISDDGFYSVDVPGELFQLSPDYQAPDRRQFADMSNGSYYIVTRVKTHARFLNQSDEDVLKKVDSLLYENIPGKIISKEKIIKNRYPGYNITARTRRGDLQRYNILITPFEILIFKMSGKENYVSGEEAERFFSSIKLKEPEQDPIVFVPPGGGFTVKFPQSPHQYLNPSGRWEYEASDKRNGNAYLILKKSVYNFGYLDEDEFYLSLLEESFRNDELFGKQVSRKIIRFYDNRKALETKEKLKDGSLMHVLYFIDGPHYYIMALRGNKSSADAWFSSIKFSPYRYPVAVNYTDTFLNVSVLSRVVPDIDAGLRSIIERSSDDVANGHNTSGYISYWQKIKNGVFRNDSTGEMVSVQVQAFPKYFYIKDSVKYWANEINDLRNKNDMVVRKTTVLPYKNVAGVKVSLQDTGSSRIIQKLIIIRDNYKYIVTAVSDSLENESVFIKDFFSTFRPHADSAASIFQSRLPLFFADLFSGDSLTKARAQQAVPNIYFGLEGVPFIKDALNRLSVSEKLYYETKSRLISELGYIKDSTGQHVVPLLVSVYNKAADTSLFQNEVIKSLSRQQTKEAYQELKKLMLKDPPVFDNNYDMNSIFNNLKDSLEVSAALFPDILQLTSLDDYKERVLSLLVKMADSNIVQKESYDKYFSSIFIDAKVSLKKQKIRDEKRRQQEAAKTETEPVRVYSNTNSENPLINYSILLMPYYQNKEVQNFFQGILQSSDEKLKLNTAVLMLRNSKPVPDSLLLALASDDKYRGLLFDKMTEVKISHLFPAKYRTQADLARSYVMMQNGYDKMDSLVFLAKKETTFKGKPGIVYFFKYRIQQTNDWKIALTGFQPVNEKEVKSDPMIAVLSDTKLEKDEPVDEQLNSQLKKVLFSYYKSGKNFYTGNSRF